MTEQRPWWEPGDPAGPDERDPLTGGPKLRPPAPPEPLLYPGIEDATQLIQRITDTAGPEEAHVIPAVEQTLQIANRPLAPRRDQHLHAPARSAAPPRRPSWQDDPRTELIPRIPAAPGPSPDEQPTATVDAAEVGAAAAAARTTTTAPERSATVVRAGAMMAVATLVSRITGFISKAMLGAALGAYIVNDSFNVANTLPNIVFELVVGGVLTSVAIPLLSRARSDPDGGRLYTQRLMTVGVVGLVVITALAVLAAPLFTAIYVSGDANADPALTTALARLLLPQILFYGLAALFGAVLNTQERFAAPAWAPVVNNVVVIGVAVLLLRLPGGVFGPDGLAAPTSTQLYVLGIGTTLGIVVQAAVMVPALLRSGFRFRWRWGGDPRLRQAGRLMVWSVLYALVSAVAFAIVSRVLTSEFKGGVTAFNYASMLFQLPYGILGVSLLTAIMPRMSRHAAAGDVAAVKNDASLANRLSVIALLPVAAALVALGIPLASLAFQRGQLTEASAATIGLTLAALSLGLVPLAVTLVQMRVFYAMHDARTPTLINLVMVAVRIPLVLLCPLLPADRVAAGVALATAISYLVGAVVGELWLRHRFGPMGTSRLLSTTARTLGATVPAAAVAWFVADVVSPADRTALSSLLQFGAGAVAGVLVLVPLLLALRLSELEPVRRRLASLLGFPTRRTTGPDLAPSDRQHQPAPQRAPAQHAPAPQHRPAPQPQFRPAPQQPAPQHRPAPQQPPQYRPAPQQQPAPQHRPGPPLGRPVPPPQQRPPHRQGPPPGQQPRPGPQQPPPRNPQGPPPGQRRPPHDQPPPPERRRQP